VRDGERVHPPATWATALASSVGVAIPVFAIRSIELPSRRLLIAVAAGVAATALIGSAGALGAGSQTVACTGGASQCTAKVSLAGGASNKVITVKLTDTNLHLASKSAPKADKGAYSITKAKYTMGGSMGKQVGACVSP
jgi:hypothetical protein